GSCSPHDWADGHWEHRPRPRVPGVNDTAMVHRDDVFKYNGLQGCASTREFHWHLRADNEGLFDRFPAVTEYVWVPSPRCSGVEPLSPEGLIKHLVEEGSWLVLGDSVTENHFFSLSCTLFPHVRAMPNYTENPYFDRAWPQHLYLNPNSPIIKTLDMPEGFDIAETPLVTFRRMDLLLTKPELEQLHRAKHPEMYTSGNFVLFGDEQDWNRSPKEYFEWFTAPAPMRYATLLTNTGGHWHSNLLEGLKDEEAEGKGIRAVLQFFGEAMEYWAHEAQAYMDNIRVKEDNEQLRIAGLGGAGRKGGVKQLRREVLVRGYTPGHEDCHAEREPWTVFHPEIAFRWRWFNWAWIHSDMNEMFEKILASPRYPDLHFLRIENPALLRPDAHGPSDCLHLMSGSGVLESFTHYVWHYVSKELP
ncbi:hypothetical protein PENSPDRAFT_565478, partial [Peniophora sp. CONT]